MKRGSLWNLAVAIVLLGLVAVNWGLALITGHMRLQPKDLMLDGALLVLAVGRLLRFLTPEMALIKPLRILGTVMVVGYFLMKMTM
jgi:hypothetical protein